MLLEAFHIPPFESLCSAELGQHLSIGTGLTVLATAIKVELSRR